jgi:hypothetical protein
MYVLIIYLALIDLGLYIKKFYSLYMDYTLYR